MGLMIDIKPARKPMESEPDADEDYEKDGEREVTDEQRAAGAELADAVKKGDSEAVYLAVCNILEMHMAEEDEEKDEEKLGDTSMPSPVTLSQIITAGRRQAGMDVTPSDTFVSDEEATYMAQRSVQALYDLLIGAQGEEYYLTETSISVVPYTGTGTNIYDLPFDFYKLSGCYIQAPSLYGFFSLEPFMQKDVAWLRTQGIVGFWNPTEMRFRLRGTQGSTFNVPPGISSATLPVAQIELLPEPRTPCTLFVRYIPQCIQPGFNPSPPPVHDSVIDGINGWEEWAILDLAIKMLEKEERDTSALLGQKSACELRIMALAGERDVADPERVVDVRGNLRLAALRRNGGARTRWWYPLWPFGACARATRRVTRRA